VPHTKGKGVSPWQPECQEKKQKKTKAPKSQRWGGLRGGTPRRGGQSRKEGGGKKKKERRGLELRDHLAEEGEDIEPESDNREGKILYRAQGGEEKGRYDRQAKVVEHGFSSPASCRARRST